MKDLIVHDVMITMMFSEGLINLYLFNLLWVPAVHRYNHSLTLLITEQLHCISWGCNALLKGTPEPEELISQQINCWFSIPVVFFSQHNYSFNLDWLVTSYVYLRTKNTAFSIAANSLLSLSQVCHRGLYNLYMAFSFIVSKHPLKI